MFLQMVQARERQLNQYQNESKLDQVQLRFPHDTLFLAKALDYMEVLESVCVCVCVCVRACVHTCVCVVCVHTPWC